MTKEEYDVIICGLEKKRFTQAVKHFFDISGSGLLFVILMPIIITTCFVIYFDSGSPLIFKQQRMGLNGKTFNIYKFRTMKKNTASADGITLENDKRITTIGHFLRRYRIDEIPQLINVLRGEMSFVGPRPDLPDYYHLDDYSHASLLLVKPGITCPASLIYKDEAHYLSKSVNPEKTYIEEIFPQKVRLNIEYISNMSFWGDIKIMFETVLRVVVNQEFESISFRLANSKLNKFGE